MLRPIELTKNQPLKWSAGTGTDVWDLFQACIAGDLAAVERLVAKDPSLVRCQHAYRTPLYFAVRENRLEVASFLLHHCGDPLSARAIHATVRPPVLGTSAWPLITRLCRRSTFVGPSLRSRFRSPSTWNPLNGMPAPVGVPRD